MSNPKTIFNRAQKKHRTKNRLIGHINAIRLGEHNRQPEHSKPDNKLDILDADQILDIPIERYLTAHELSKPSGCLPHRIYDFIFILYNHLSGKLQSPQILALF